MSRPKMVLLGWAMVTAAAVTAVRAADDWGTYLHDNQHTSRSDVSFDPRQLQLAWQSPIGYIDPVVAGESVYGHTVRSSVQGTANCLVTSFDRQTGSVNWSYGDGFYNVSPVTVASGLAVYEASRLASNGGLDYDLYVHDAATGALKYRVPIGYGRETAVTVNRESDGTVVAYLSTDGIAAFQLGETAASVKWVAGSGWSDLSPGVIAGESVVGGNASKAWAYDRSTGAGSMFWGTGGTTGGVIAGVAYDRNSGRLFVNTQLDGLRAFQYAGQSNITPLWTTTTFYGGSNPPAIAEDGTLYVVRGGTGQLVELDPTTGLPLRTSTASDFVTDNPPVLQPGYIWASARVGLFATELRVLDADTLQTVRSFAAGPQGVLFRPPVLTDGTMVMPIYSGSSDYKVFQVYLIPEPAAAATLSVLAGCGVIYRRPRRS